MLDPEEAQRTHARRWRAYTWGVLAALTCPCHLPVLAAVLAGTSAGAFVSEHWVIAALALIGLFILSVARALQAFRGIS